MTKKTRELLDACQVQLAESEVLLERSRELIEAEGLSHLLAEEAELGYGENQNDYAPTWADPLAEPFFIPQGRNELDALFDDAEATPPLDDDGGAFFDAIFNGELDSLFDEE